MDFDVFIPPVADSGKTVKRLRELARAGYGHFGIGIGYGHPERLAEWAEVFDGV